MLGSLENWDTISYVFAGFILFIVLLSILAVVLRKVKIDCFDFDSNDSIYKKRKIDNSCKAFK